MNRRKKINSILKKRAKKANEKNCISNKPRYISKADRAAAAELEQQNTALSSEAGANEDESNLTD